MPELPESEMRYPGRTAFTSTHWSVVLAAAQNGAPDNVSALEKLCRTYWYPLYAYVRRGGYSAHDAQDLVQGFFARFLEKNYLQSVNRDKGRFRSFLLASLNHFISDEWDRSRRLILPIQTWYRWAQK